VAIEGARPEDIEVVAAVFKRMKIDCDMRDGTFTVRPSTPRAAVASPPALAGVPERSGQPGHRARHAGGGTHAGARLDVRAALFALEQMSGMGADLFLADAHRIIVNGPTQLRGGRFSTVAICAPECR
jgi:hypothetical protein